MTINTDVIDYFVEYNGKTGEFYYYDKVAKAKRPLDITSLAVMNVGYTISWYSGKHSCGIYSNEVSDLRDEEFEVKAFTKDDHTLLQKGLYKDIKNDVVVSGGKLHICLTALSGMEVVHLKLKWAAFYEYTQTEYNQAAEKLDIAWIEDRKNGAIEYKVPKFEKWDKFTENEKSLIADLRSKLLKTENKEDSNDLPF